MTDKKKTNGLKSQRGFKVKTPNCLKRGKTRATPSWLVLVLHLIGWESGASCLDQSQIRSEAKPMQSWMTFDTVENDSMRAFGLILIDSTFTWNITQSSHVQYFQFALFLVTGFRLHLTAFRYYLQEVIIVQRFSKDFIKIIFDDNYIFLVIRYRMIKLLLKR